MDASAPAVFQLYQPGLAPDHVLQLCYLRRRAPRLLNINRIQAELVLPRPELKIADVLSSLNIPLQQLVTAPSTCDSSSRTTAEPLTKNNAKETATKHVLHPQRAAAEDVRQWSVLSESDWIQIFSSIQQPTKRQGEDDEMTGIAIPLLDVLDVCWLFEQCPSDGFANFVWDHLLLSLLQQNDDGNASITSAQKQLLSLLVNHHLFASLSPKDFRTKVRARNLRQVGDVVGAQAELALVALYREQRDCTK